MSQLGSGSVSQTSLNRSRTSLGGPFSSQASVDTGHEELINDAKMDYYSTKLATASSDKSVRVFSIDCRTGGYHKLASLTGYTGQVLKVAWSHPQFGSLLATACYDGRIIIWKEEENQATVQGTVSRWNPVYDQRNHSSSVNSVSWCAHEIGALLAAGSSDGSVSIIDQAKDWAIERIPKAHTLGVMDVCWSSHAKRFASGGNDNLIKVWRNNDAKWQLENTLQGHTDWVYSVQWSPIADILASAGRDGRIIVWTENDEPEVPQFNHSINKSSCADHIIDLSISEPEDWTLQVLQTSERGSTPHLSWDPMGIFLSISADEKEVAIWKQEDDNWVLATKPRISNCKLSESFGV